MSRDVRGAKHVIRPKVGEKVWTVKWVCAEEDEVNVEDEEEEFGQRKVKKIQDPKAPTKEEREEHEKTHLPFRNWCKHCIRGRSY